VISAVSFSIRMVFEDKRFSVSGTQIRCYRLCRF
jgi:hypothetical protein